MAELTALDVFARLRKACSAAGGQSAWAAQNRVSPQYVSDVINGRTDPGESILRALGLARRVRYVEFRKEAAP